MAAATQPARSRLVNTCLHLIRSSDVAAAQQELLPVELSARRPALSSGKLPQRVSISDRDAVATALKVDGVVILTDLPGDETEAGYWEHTAGALPSMTFGEDNLVPGAPPVSAVHQEFARSSQVRQLQAQQGIVGGAINKLGAEELLAEAQAQGMPHYTEVPWKEMSKANPHTDGYVYGDHVPDHIFLLMETQNDFGGESFFVDGEAVLERLRADPEADTLLPLLSTLVYDQTESEANGGLFQGRASSGPLFSRREDGRLQWKRMLARADTQNGQLEAAEAARRDSDLRDFGTKVPRSCWGVTAETSALAKELGSSLSPADVLERVDLAIHAESEAAGRVRLGKGEAVVVDNYRMLHSREAFGGDGERRLWRVWTWTTDSDGRPNEDAAPVSTPLDIHLEETAAAAATADADVTSE
jgi:alpha-ketoglutarate-dependent taurine dioxygenase